MHLHKNPLEHQQSLASAAARPPHVHRGAARLGRGSLVVSLLLLLRIEPANNCEAQARGRQGSARDGRDENILCNQIKSMFNFPIDINDKEIILMENFR